MKKLFKKRPLILSAVLILILTSFSGCIGGNPSKEPETVSLYFANKDGNDLIEEKYKVARSDTAEMVRDIISKLLTPPTKTDIKMAINEGTSLLSVSVKDSNVKVNFSKEFEYSDNILTVLAASSVVKSVCSLDEINSVEVFVAGRELTLPTQGPISDDCLVFNADALTDNEVNVKLYFSDDQAEYLVGELRKVSVPKGETVEKIILQQLIKGPQKQNSYKTVPAETKIRSVETTDGVCFVNLSSEFITKHPGGSAGELMTIYSIVNSLTELSNVDKVQFLIEGEKKEVFMHLIFNEPFDRDVTMIAK